MDKLAQAFHFRHACKIFDDTKKIPSTEIDYILDAGRTSPSSFGLEPWYFVVIENQEIKQQLKPLHYDQQQIVTCSHLVIVLYRKSLQFTLQSEYLRQAVQRSLPVEGSTFDLDAACQYFVNYTHSLPQNISVDNWAEMQCYIPCANMMTAAAYHNIDSCAIGGFQHDKVMSELEKHRPLINPNHFGIALTLAFGYRKNKQPEKIRWSTEEVVTFL